MKKLKNLWKKKLGKVVIIIGILVLIPIIMGMIGGIYEAATGKHQPTEQVVEEKSQEDIIKEQLNEMTKRFGTEEEVKVVYNGSDKTLVIMDSSPGVGYKELWYNNIRKFLSDFKALNITDSVEAISFRRMGLVTDVHGNDTNAILLPYEIKKENIEKTNFDNINEEQLKALSSNVFENPVLND